jgi:hypothetical protein
MSGVRRQICKWLNIIDVRTAIPSSTSQRPAFERYDSYVENPIPFPGA